MLLTALRLVRLLRSRNLLNRRLGRRELAIVLYFVSADGAGVML